MITFIIGCFIGTFIGIVIMSIAQLTGTNDN